MSMNEQALLQQPLPRMVVSTDKVCERDRVPFFRDELARILNLEMTPLSEGPPQFVMNHIAAGPIGFNLMEGTPSRYLRTRRHLADCDENFTFGIFTSGFETFSQNGRESRVETGEAFLLANAMPEDALIPVHATVTVLSVDGPALRALVRHPERMAGEHFTADRPGLALLKGYLRAFSTTVDTLSPDLVGSFGQHVLDLIAAMLETSGNATAAAEAGGIRAARLSAVLAAIAERATDPEFGVESVAAELAVTARYVQRLLEETGTTFSEHLAAARLGRAWDLLTDPDSVDQKVAAIAFDCGFRDLTTFNRAFRRRFGESPTAVRGAARPEHAPDADGFVSPLAVSLTRH